MTLNKIIEELENRKNFLIKKKDELVVKEMPLKKRFEKEREYKKELEIIYCMLDIYHKNK